MARPASTSFSILIGIVFLLLLLLSFVLIFTNQFLSDVIQKQDAISPILIGLSIVFILIFVVILSINIVRLVRDARADRPGVRFKVRLVYFFGALVLLSSVPVVVLTGNLLRIAFDVWFVKDTSESLAFGSDTAVQYYKDKVETLRAFASSEYLPGLIQSAEKDPDRTWKRIQDLNSNIDSLQVFRNSIQVLARGDPALWLGADDLQYLSEGQVTPETRDQTSILRMLVASSDPQASPRELTVVSLRLADGYSHGASLISDTSRKLDNFLKVQRSFPLAVFALYVLFFIPLLLISLMLSFYLADEINKPLEELERAVHRVAEGDYLTRLIVRKNDPLGYFINSFNEMVGELERSRSDLKQSERLQTWQEIAQRMAHEIKNPLTPIRLSAERIQKRYTQGGDDVARVVSDGVSTIIQEVGSISRLLTEFRDFARLPQPVPESVNLRSLVADTWQIYADSTQIRLDQSGLNPDLTLRIDRGQFMQVLKNLFQNAIDAINARDSRDPENPPSEGIIHVRAYSLDRLGQRVVRLQIQDNGLGMSREQLLEVFIPYYTTKKHGSGLGLAIVEKIILDHGGRIWVESRPGQGASFFIDMPGNLNIGKTE